MARKISKNVIDGKWNYVGHKIMAKLIAEFDTFSADDFFNEALKTGMSHAQIRKNVSKLFRQFKAAKKIKSNGCKTSERNDAALIRTWVKV